MCTFRSKKAKKRKTEEWGCTLQAWFPTTFGSLERLHLLENMVFHCRRSQLLSTLTFCRDRVTFSNLWSGRLWSCLSPRSISRRLLDKIKWVAFLKLWILDLILGLHLLCRDSPACLWNSFFNSLLTSELYPAPYPGLRYGLNWNGSHRSLFWIRFPQLGVSFRKLWEY